MTTNIATTITITDYIDTLDTEINSLHYTVVIAALTYFFAIKKKYTEICTQNRFGILAACEQPETVVKINYCGKDWPLPQTGQMWLEYEILTKPSLSTGVFCRTTSYREEKNPIQGRHMVCFPLFEFETLGTFTDLLTLLDELLIFLGYNKAVHLDYTEMATRYQANSLEHEHEQRMYKEYGSACFLKHFRYEDNPFWNMKFNPEGTIANKVDVILSGMETIGCAERSCNNEQMTKMFYSLCNGEYHKLIFDKFTKERTEAELTAFMNLPKQPRIGAGLGVTRLISSLVKEGLMDSLIERYANGTF